MESKNQWKEGHKLDSVMNVLLIVLALGVLGLGAVEMSVDQARIDEPTQQT